MGDIRSLTIDQFEKVNFNELDDEWIEELVDTEFSDVTESNVSTSLLFVDEAVSILCELAELCNRWCNLSQDSNTSFEVSEQDEYTLWSELSKIDITVRQIKGLVYQLCFKATKSESSIEDREVGLACAKWYFSCLRTPGSSAYSVFHPNLYCLSLNCLAVPELYPENKSSNNLSDIEEIVPMVISSLESLVRLLSSFHLGNDPAPTEYTIQKLVELCSCETSSQVKFDHNFADMGKREKRSYVKTYIITAMAYQGLSSLVQSELNGEIEYNYSVVLAYLRRLILCLKAKKCTTIPHKFLVVKDNAVSFMRFNLKKNLDIYSKETLVGLKRLCLLVLERSEFRFMVAQTVFKIMYKLTIGDLAEMIQWLLQLSDSSDIKDRIFSLDVLGEILSGKPSVSCSDVDESTAIYFTEGPIVFQILTRCDDVSPNVRTKALSILSQNMNSILKFLDRYKDQNLLSEEFEEFSDINGDDRSFWYKITSHRERLDQIASILHRRTDDCNVTARKAALQALENLISFDLTYLNAQNLKLFTIALEDTNVVVRRQMIQSLTTVLESFHTSPLVQDYWLRSILPLVQDPENTVQTKAFNVMEEQFIHKLFSNIDWKQSCAFALLKKLSCGKFIPYQNYLHKAFASWKMELKLKPQMIMQLEIFLCDDLSDVIWFYVSIFVAYSKIPPKMQLITVEEFRKLNATQTFPASIEYLVKILKCVCGSLSETDLQSLKSIIKENLSNYSIPIEYISSYIEVLTVIHKEAKEENELQEFADKTMKSCTDSLSSFVVQQSTDKSLSEDLIARKMCTAKEFCHFYPSNITQNLLLVLKTFVTSKNIQKSSDPSASVTNLHAHAFAALGSLCLQDETLAKELIPALAKEMLTSNHSVIRSNVVVIMTEMCKRYTSYADKYVPMISLCFKDPLYIIRFQSLTMLISLLQEDYIKWKAPLFYCLLSTIIDKNEAIQELGRYCLCDLLTKKKPTLFAERFIDSIFVFNNYSPSNNNSLASMVHQLEKFSLQGETNAKKRLQLYKFMLENISYTQRVLLVSPIGQTIFAPISCSVLPLNTKTETMVRDCFAILSCEELEYVEEKESEEGEDKEPQESAQKEKLIQRLLVIEPIKEDIILLAKTAENSKSKLTEDIIVFWTNILQNHKSDIKEILGSNFTLRRNVELALRKELVNSMREPEVNNQRDQDEFVPQQQRVRMSLKSKDMFNIMMHGEDIDSEEPPNTTETQTNVISSTTERPKRKCTTQDDAGPSTVPDVCAEITQYLDGNTSPSQRAAVSKIMKHHFASTPRVILKPMSLSGDISSIQLEDFDES